jgi:hypothetical protein
MYPSEDNTETCLSISFVYFILLSPQQRIYLGGLHSIFSANHQLSLAKIFYAADTASNKTGFQATSNKMNS